MAARPLPKYRSRHGRCPAGCLRRLHVWLIPKGPARKVPVMTKMKCAWRSPPNVTGTPELRVRRKKARKDAWSTMSGRRAISDIGAAGSEHVVLFHFNPMHGNMVRAVGFHTVFPRSSNETCPAFVWRTNRALPVSFLRYGSDRG